MFIFWGILGYFRAIMILLGLIWISILTVGLVEVCNYLYHQRRVAQLAADRDCLANEELMPRSPEMAKKPFQILVIPTSPDRDP